MPEHIVTIDNIGGTDTLSCAPLGIMTIEYPFKEITGEGIKKAILDYKYLSEEEVKFDLIILDNRPEPINYNLQKAQESKDFKKERNELFTSKTKVTT